MIDPGPTPELRALGRLLDGRFELTRFLAKGGMGWVYMAKQRPLDRVVAIKLLDPASCADAGFRERFFLEATSCARLSHPNTVRVYDFGCDDGAYYIAMEYLDGGTLAQRIAEEGTLPPRASLDILAQISSALVEAHAEGLIHRDLKPSNLIFSSHPTLDEFIKIVDFGIAKQLDAEVGELASATLLGSPAYMSPEQVCGARVDVRSDIYSLGAVAFHMLTGTQPFRGATPLNVMMSQVEREPPSFADANPSLDLPSSLEQIVRCCLDKDPACRYPSARELLAALEACRPTLPEDARAPKVASTSAPVSASVPPSSPSENSGPTQPPFTSSFDEDMTLVGDTITPSLGERLLDGYAGYIDLNCPFCHALHERMCAWGLVDKLEWRMVEHATHVLEGPFGSDEEEQLAKEVFAVHHRAPDIEVELPPRRCDASLANRLLVVAQRRHPDKLSGLRAQLYRALWQRGLDVGSPAVLLEALARVGLPATLLDGLDQLEAEPPELVRWQQDWERPAFDHSIPVLVHSASERMLVGLPSQRTLLEFLFGESSRLVDSSVCYYQRRPVLLLCGRLGELWSLLADVRKSCELLQLGSIAEALAKLDELAVPDMILIDDQLGDHEALARLAARARARSVHWVLASREPGVEAEVRALELGAAEYLPLQGEGGLARARLQRILRDRFSADRLQRERDVDPLTRASSRRRFIVRLEQEWEQALRLGSSLSLVLVDIDGFKAFNNAKGYLAGNRYLVEIADLIRAALPGSPELLARFGGDEFAVLLPATAHAQARAFIDRLREVLTAHAGRAGPGLSLGVGSLLATPSASVHELHDLAWSDLVAGREGAEDGAAS